ncbi:helix-turn-helix domain-containing protein [uncultured Parasutterella sp.]|uniref:helix-turn-helix domain-containing protein n=1 Tax=uncultured Parasutterella sp. TaxID=1263098 RepID=UPI0034455399
MDEKNIVKSLCSELGVTQKQLGEMFNISQPSVALWVHKNSFPRMVGIFLRTKYPHLKTWSLIDARHSTESSNQQGINK